MRLFTIGFFVSLVISGLQAEVQAQVARQDTLKELMRQIEILTEEIEKQKLGDVAVEEETEQRRFGLGPAASRVYFKKETGVSLAGYGEVVYENFSAKRDDGTDSPAKDRIDFLRNIMYLGYRFNDRLFFNSEIEIEHALVGGGAPGALAIEFGYVDALLTDAWAVRAGMMLIPVGLVNEYHEPPTFATALRTETERYIIPTTWRGNGAGLMYTGANGLNLKLFVVEGMRAEGYSATGIRGGRQKGAKATVENFAFTGRAEYSGIRGVQLGASWYLGNSAQGLVAADGSNSGFFTAIYSLHWIYTRSGLDFRGLYARATVSDAALLNQTLGRSAVDAIPSVGQGYYVTASYNIMPWFNAMTQAELRPFVHYEKLNPALELPVGFTGAPSQERTNMIAGLIFKPISLVVFKAEYMNRNNPAGTATNQFNLAVNYMF